MRMRWAAGAGAVLCGIGGVAVALGLGGRLDSLMLAAAGAACLAQSGGVARADFGSQKRALVAELALLGLTLSLAPSQGAAAALAFGAAGALAALLFSRTAAHGDTFAAGDTEWRTGTLAYCVTGTAMTLLSRLPERTTTGVEAFAGRPAARRQLI